MSKKTFDYLFKPHAFVTDASFYPTQQLTKPHWKTYGLGWFQHDYRGEKLDFHTGSLGGLIAICGIIRDKNTAVYVFANMDHAELRHAIMYKAMDLFAFDDNSTDWHQEIFELYSKFKKQQKEYVEKMRSDRVKDTEPTLDLAAYEGEYTHPMLGKAMVKRTDTGLTIDFNSFMSLDTYHWQYNTFMSTKENPYRAEIDFNFLIGSDGKVKALEAFGDKFDKQN